MEMTRVVGFAVVAVSLVLILRQSRPELGLLAALGSSLVILAAALWGMEQILSAAQEMARRAGVAGDYTQVLFRSLGLCVITQLASDTCRDAGESAIASRVELAGRVAVLLCGLPLFQKLLELALALVSL